MDSVKMRRFCPSIREGERGLRLKRTGDSSAIKKGSFLTTSNNNLMSAGDGPGSKKKKDAMDEVVCGTTVAAPKGKRKGKMLVRMERRGRESGKK